MIEQTNQFLNANCCFNCHSIMGLDHDWYCIQVMGTSPDLDNNGFTLLDFPNGKKKFIVFCHPCWDLIAGKRYTFSKEMPLPKDLVYDLLNEVINKIPFKP